MTDSSLRDLERRFRATGSVEDEAAWLRQRVRLGEVQLGAVAVGWHLDYPACVVGWPTAPTSLSKFRIRGPYGDVLTDAERAQVSRISQVFVGMKTQKGWGGKRAQVRLLIALARRFEADARAWTGDPERHPRALGTCEEWAVSPSKSGVAKMEAALGDHAELPLQELPMLAEPGHAWPCLVEVACWHISGGAEPDTWYAIEKLRQESRFGPTANMEASSALHAELVPWLLGYSDPVRERVEARQREAAGE